MPLTREEIKQCRDSFDNFDKDGGGTVDVMELKVILNGLGALPSDEELQLMIQQVDEDGSREINFAVFLKIIERHKAMQGYVDQTEVDTLEAFAALGGGPDGSGSVSLDNVAALIKEFELEITATDLPVTSQDGMISYAHFKVMMA